MADQKFQDFTLQASLDGTHYVVGYVPGVGYIRIPVSAFIGAGGGAASSISYDNASSGLTATQVQAAIDELAGAESTFAGLDNVGYIDGDELLAILKGGLPYVVTPEVLRVDAHRRIQGFEGTVRDVASQFLNSATNFTSNTDGAQFGSEPFRIMASGGGSVSQDNSLDSSCIGVARCQTSASTSGKAGVVALTGPISLAKSGVNLTNFKFNFFGGISGLPTAGNECQYFIGLTSALTVNPATFLGFRLTKDSAGGEWECVCRVGGVETSSNLSSNLVAANISGAFQANFLAVQLIYNAAVGNVEFWLGDYNIDLAMAKVREYADTLNFPVGVLYPAAYVANNIAGAANNQIAVDYCAFRLEKPNLNAISMGYMK